VFNKGIVWPKVWGCCCCRSYHSDDPLDLGEALWLSHWQLGTAQSAPEGLEHPAGSAWAHHMSGVSLASLEELWTEGYFQQPLRWRLGFREFGTSIGLQVSISNMTATLHNRLTDQAGFHPRRRRDSRGNGEASLSTRGSVEGRMSS